MAEATTPEAERALAYLAQAETDALVIPGVGPEVQPRPVASAAVIGSGTMGGGIAMTFANAGIPVQVLDIDRAALDRGMETVARNYGVSVSRGRLTQEEMDARLARITAVTSYDAIGQADIVIEAVFEDLALKQQIFETLDAVMRPGAVLGSNTSSLDIDAIAAATKRPQDVIGTHFFSPANVMRLQENVRGRLSAPETIATVMTLARRIGKVPVLAGNCDGFIGNRILAVYGREADFLIEEGATPWQLDEALKAFGFPMGVFLMRDMAGLDVGWRIRQHRAKTRDPNERYSPIGDRLYEAGRLGQKTGSGYYRYEGRTASPDPDTLALIEAVSAELGIERRPISDDEIVTRILTSMVNEGTRIVETGIALRASDIDVTYAYGYGFPKDKGGPMYWAEQRGLGRVLADVERYYAAHGALWTPSALLRRLAESGRGWRDA